MGGQADHDADGIGPSLNCRYHIGDERSPPPGTTDGSLLDPAVCGLVALATSLPTVAPTVARRLLDEAAPGALLLSRSDETTFALRYTQATGQRRDVVVVDERLLARAWYRDQLARRHPDLPPTPVDLGAPAPGRARFVVEGPPPLARLRALD